MIIENKEDLKQLLVIIEEESRQTGFELNRKKTEVIMISQNNECPQIDIFTIGNKVKQRDQFKYLCTLISSDGCNTTEIASRIAQANKGFQKMRSILKHKHISIHKRRRVPECYIEPILIYGCEAWTI